MIWHESRKRTKPKMRWIGWRTALDLGDGWVLAGRRDWRRGFVRLSRGAVHGHHPHVALVLVVTRVQDTVALAHRVEEEPTALQVWKSHKYWSKYVKYLNYNNFCIQIWWESRVMLLLIFSLFEPYLAPIMQSLSPKLSCQPSSHVKLKELNHWLKLHLPIPTIRFAAKTHIN